MDTKLFDSSIISTAEQAVDFIGNILESSTEYSILGEDLDGKILLWNEGARRLFGYEPEEVVGKANSSILHVPDDIQAGTHQKLRQIALRDGKWEGTLMRARKNGQHFTARLVITPRHDSAGKAIGYLLISKDISVEIRLTEELKATQFYARSLIEASLDPLVTISPEGKITDVNEASVQATGTAREHLVGTDFSDYFTEPDRAREGYQQVFSQGYVRDYPLAIRHISGRITDVLYNASVYKDDKGNVLGVLAAARDVTLQKQVAVLLRESEERFSAILRLANDAVVSVDESQCIQLFNEAAEKIFGYQADEVLGKPLEMLLPSRFRAAHPAHVSEFAKALESSHRMGERRELFGRRKDGTDFPAEASISKFHLQGRLTFTAFVSDITERRQAEAKQRATAAYARSLIEASLDPLVTISPEGKITDVNRATELVTGIPRQRLTGTDFSDYFTEPDRAREGYQQVFSQGLAKDYPLAIRHTSARITDVLYNACVYKDDKGNVLGVFAAARDVTERKMAEELQRASSAHARSLIEASLDPLVTISAQGKITDVNEASVQATGVAREQLVGTDFSDYFTEPDKARSGYQKAFSEGFVRDYPLAIRHASGRILDVLYNAGVYKDDKGNVLGVFAAARDVTERKQMEAALMDADRRKDEFLATLAHELRNPLAAVSNSLELMKRASGNAAVMERAHTTMERQMAQMVHLIDDLLDVSRITRNRLDLRLERVELASVVQHAAEACRPLCEHAGHQLIVTLPPEPIILNADPMRLAQVFGNLLNNACKYTHGGGSIWLSAELQGSEVALTFKDSGVGIAPDMLQKVFDLFTQVGSSLERSQGGLGIGLSLAKRLTELHGGRLTAHSQGKDRGSAFVVRLPVLLETPGPAAPVPMAAPAPPTAGRRILVVDDMRESADSLAMLLSMDGNETQTAYDGLEAVDSAAAFRPDVILLDIGVPGMNGYEACRAIRQQPWGKRIAIIALTGWGQDEDRRKSREAGFDHHLVKPVKFEDLVELLAGLQAPKA